MRNFGIAVAGALASLGYWYVVSLVAFSVGSGDVAPSAPPPPAAAQQLRIVAVMAVAVVVYAAASLAWHRLYRPRLTAPSA